MLSPIEAASNNMLFCSWISTRTQPMIIHYFALLYLDHIIVDFLGVPVDKVYLLGAAVPPDIMLLAVVDVSHGHNLKLEEEEEQEEKIVGDRTGLQSQWSESQCWILEQGVAVPRQLNHHSLLCHSRNASRQLPLMTTLTCQTQSTLCRHNTSRGCTSTYKHTYTHS